MSARVCRTSLCGWWETDGRQPTEWWTGEALPEAKVVRRELAGVPKIEVVGLSKEKVEEIFWDAVTQARADLAGVSRK